MASSSISSSRSNPSVATLVPQGAHAGKQSMPLNRPLTIVGSRHRAHLHLLSRTVSKTHAIFVNTAQGIYIRDLASRTHVLINGKAEKEKLLASGDLITIGSFTFRYNAASGRPGKAPSPPAASLQVDGSPIPIEIDTQTVLIGRRATCDIPLTEMSVSTCHAVIYTLDGVRYVRDLGSRTGTFVNGQTVHQHALELGDRLRIGDTEIAYISTDDEANLDELEDLVGTASLTDDAIAMLPARDEQAAGEAAGEIANEIPADDALEVVSASDASYPRAAEPVRVTTAAHPDPADELNFAEPEPTTAPAAPESVKHAPATEADDDLIPLAGDEDDHRSARTPASASPSKGKPAAEIDELDFAPIERGAAAPSPASVAPPRPARAAPGEESFELTPPTDLLEFDLASDPDVSGPGDTARIPVEHILGMASTKPPVRPAISDLLVEDPMEDLGVEGPLLGGEAPAEGLSDTIDLHSDDETSHLLVDANLHDQRLTSSGTFAGLDSELAEAIESPAGDVQASVKDLSLGKWDNSDASINELATTAELEHTPAELPANARPEPAAAPTLTVTTSEPADDSASASSDASPHHGGVASSETIASVPPHTTASDEAGAEPEPSAWADDPLGDIDLSSRDFSDGAHAADRSDETGVGAQSDAAPAAGVQAPAGPLLGLTAAAATTTGVVAGFGNLLGAGVGLTHAPGASAALDDQAPQDSAPNRVQADAKAHEGPVSDDEAAEIISSTMPTPESAQGLAAQVTASDVNPLAGDLESSLTDSTFARAVDEFSGSQLESVEEHPTTAELPKPQITTTEAAVSPKALGSVQTDGLAEIDLSSLPDDALSSVAELLPMPAPMPQTEISRASFDLGFMDDAPMTESGLTDLSFEIAEQVLASDAAFAPMHDLSEESAHGLGVVSEDPFASATVEDLEAPLELEPLSASAETSAAANSDDDLAALLGEPSPAIEFTPASSDAEPPTLLNARERAATSLVAELPNAARPAEISSAPASSTSGNAADPAPGLDLAALGLSRDAGSFIGGIPINWESSDAQVAGDAAASIEPPEIMEGTALADGIPDAGAEGLSFTDSPDAFVPDALISETLADPGQDELNFANDGSDDTLATFLSRLDTAEPAPELFESAPHTLDQLPDSMQPIQDVVEVLGEKPRPAQATDPLEIAAPPKPAPRKTTERTAREAVKPLTPPRVVPPPPPAWGKRAKAAAAPAARNPFGGGFEAPANATPAEEVVIPPYTGNKPASAGHVATVFEGLATPPVRETDVFSQLSNPPASGLLSGLSAGAGMTASKVRHGLTGAELVGGESAARRGRGVALPPPSGHEQRLTIPDYVPAPRAGAGGTPTPRFPGAAAKATFQSAMPGRRSRIPLGLLLSVIAILAATSLVAIYYFVHAQATADVFMRFERLDKAGSQDQMELQRKEREILSAAETRKFARDMYHTEMGGRGGDGFLGSDPDDTRAYAGLVDSMTLGSDNKLALHMATMEPATDKQRLLALLRAVYSDGRNQKMIDDAGAAKRAHDALIDGINAGRAKLAEVTERLKAESQAGAKLVDAQATVNQLKSENARLWKAWNDSAEQFLLAQQDVKRLDLKSTPSDSTDSGDVATKPEDDPQVKDLSAKLTTLTSSLARAHTARSATADAAGKALDTALSGFQERIAQARSTLKEGSQLSSYLAAAQQAQDTIRQLNADLIDRQKSEQQRLNDLRRVLAEKQEARLKDAWEKDTALQAMQQDLSVAEHQYNAANGSGLAPQAKELAAKIDTLKKQIDARRDLISTGDVYADEVKTFQQLIDGSLKDMEVERARNAQRMTDALARLAAAAPQIEKLPADQQKLAEDFENRLSEMAKAREQFTTAMAATTPDNDGAIKSLEAESTELQAKLDARRKQIAEESRKALSTQQESARAAKLAAANQRLAETRQAEQAASLAVRTNKEQLDAAQSDVDRQRALQTQMSADNTLAFQLKNDLDRQLHKAEELDVTATQSIVPEQPSEGNITMLDSPRNLRSQYMLWDALAWTLLLVGMLIHRSHGLHHHPLPATGSADGSGGFGASNGNGFEHTASLEGRGNSRASHQHEEDEATIPA